MSLILRSYLYFATENSTPISIRKKINLLIFSPKNIFVVDGLDQLLITHSVERMLWSNYNPRAESPPSGVIIAGRDETARNHSPWYSTVAVQSETTFNLLSPESKKSQSQQSCGAFIGKQQYGIFTPRNGTSDFAAELRGMYPFLRNRQSLLFHYLQSHSAEARVIPWFQYNSREYTTYFRQFCEEYVKDPFPGIIVLKPTSEEGKRHFDIRYFSGQRDHPLPAISAHEVPLVAQQHISSLMQYWVTADRFVKKGLQVL